MTEKKKIKDWDQFYRDEAVETMPWYNPRLDHDVDRMLGLMNITSGTILDLGTGPGTQAMELARRGFQVTATDISHAAVEKAAIRAGEAGLVIGFMQDDVLNSALDRQFDLIVDRGCFHIFPAERRADYARTVYRLLKPGGYLFLKCFSHRETYEDGPFRFTPEEIRELFTPLFRVLSIEDTEFHGTLDFLPKALFCVLQRPE